MTFSNSLSTIFANGNIVNDEKFAHLYALDKTVIQLLNNGRSIENVKNGVYTTTFRKMSCNFWHSFTKYTT